MSKTHSLDIKTIYQIGLFIIGTTSVIVMVLNTLEAVKLFQQEKPEAVFKAREQQLNQAINLTQSN